MKNDLDKMLEILSDKIEQTQEVHKELETPQVIEYNEGRLEAFKFCFDIVNILNTKYKVNGN